MRDDVLVNVSVDIAEGNGINSIVLLKLTQMLRVIVLHKSLGDYEDASYETKYSRMDQLKFMEDSL